MKRKSNKIYKVHFGDGFNTFCQTMALYPETSIDKNKVTCITCRGEAKGGRPVGSKNKPRDTN